MYCKFCGGEIDEASVFCAHCGKQINEKKIIDNDENGSDIIKTHDSNIIAMLCVSVIVGALIGFITFLFGEWPGLLLASIATAISFALITLRVFVQSSMRGIISFASFLLFGFIYLFLFFTVNDSGLDYFLSGFSFWFFLCSPYVILVYIWIELSRNKTSFIRMKRVFAIWVLILAALFAIFFVSKSIKHNSHDVSEKNVINNSAENNQEVLVDNNEITQPNGNDEIEYSSNNTVTDISKTDLEQKLFDSVNYALSIDLNENCDMSQSDLKAIYDGIADGTFFSGAYFEYVTEYGRDRYNYVIAYDGLTVTVYYDSTQDLYGFDIATEYVP